MLRSLASWTFCMATLFGLTTSHAQTRAEQNECKAPPPYSTTNPAPNPKPMTVQGGPCGGNVVITIKMSGCKQSGCVKENKQNDAYVQVFIEHDKKNLCADGPPAKDSNFDSFSVSCAVSLSIAPNITENFSVRYDTNYVQDGFAYSFEYAFTPKPFVK